MKDEVLREIGNKMGKTLEAVRREFASIRTGRASVSLLDGIEVEYYGSSVPLEQTANVSVPEARLLVITPYDKTTLENIEKAIQKSDLGLTATNDGKIIRINIPELTEERRKNLVKVVKRLGEEGRVALRNLRREANERIKKRQKNSEITEDDMHRLVDQVQEVTDEYSDKVNDLLNKKEEEIMEV